MLDNVRKKSQETFRIGPEHSVKLCQVIHRCCIKKIVRAGIEPMALFDEGSSIPVKGYFIIFTSPDLIDVLAATSMDWRGDSACVDKTGKNCLHPPPGRGVASGNTS